jgi:hypothetical protein
MRFGTRVRPVTGRWTAGTGPATSTRAPQPATPAMTHRDGTAAVVISGARVPHRLTRPDRDFGIRLEKDGK